LQRLQITRELIHASLDLAGIVTNPAMAKTIRISRLPIPLTRAWCLIYSMAEPWGAGGTFKTGTNVANTAMAQGNQLANQANAAAQTANNAGC